MTPVNAYILCATPRSGTTLLCGLLRDTGVAGKPDSFFRKASRADWRRDLGIDPTLDETSLAFHRAYLDAVLREGRAGGALFGMRLMQENLVDFQETLMQLSPSATSDFDRIQAQIGRTAFVHVTRDDVVAQAVSLVKAEQSGLWHRAADGSELERLHAPIEPKYDFASIDAAVRAYRTFDAAWQSWFDAQKITPHTIPYEDLSADPIGVLKRLLCALGLDPKTANGVLPSVSKIADDVSAQWCARYKADVAYSFGPNQS